MNVTVCGLRHLGVVTASCVNDHFTLACWEPDESIIEGFRQGRLPFSHKEPGLGAMMAGKLLLHLKPLEDAVSSADIIWVTFDTPVDEDDQADYDYVRRQISEIGSHCHAGQVIVISSQVPVGFTRECSRMLAGTGVEWLCSPENLRRGMGIETFVKQDRIVIGGTYNSKVDALFKPFCVHLEWMSWESAEMTKHAINAYLGMSIAFANEIAAISRRLGANVEDVERGLRTEGRIGTRLPLRSGGPFTGGTLGRDLAHLEKLVPHGVIGAVRQSNKQHAASLSAVAV